MVFRRPLLCVFASLRASAVPMRRRRQAEKLGATGFERINRNGLATEKAQNQLLMEAIPEKRLGAPSPFSCGRGIPLPSVLVDPFNSVARRFSASPHRNVGSPVRCCSFQRRSREMTRGVVPGASKPERHEIATRRAILSAAPLAPRSPQDDRYEPGYS